MNNKWVVSISMAHDCKMISVDTETQARKLYKEIAKSLDDWEKPFIDIDNTLIRTNSIESVRIDPPMEDPVELTPHCPPRDCVRKIEIPSANTPDLFDISPTYSRWPTTNKHEFTHAEKELYEKMLESDDLSEEKLVRRKKKND